MKAWSVKIVCFGETKQEAWQAFLDDTQCLDEFPKHSLRRSPSYDDDDPTWFYDDGGDA